MCVCRKLPSEARLELKHRHSVMRCLCHKWHCKDCFRFLPPRVKTFYPRGTGSSLQMANIQKEEWNTGLTALLIRWWVDAELLFSKVPWASGQPCLEHPNIPQLETWEQQAKGTANMQCSILWSLAIHICLFWVNWPRRMKLTKHVCQHCLITDYQGRSRQGNSINMAGARWWLVNSTGRYDSAYQVPYLTIYL